ncbi:PI-PLC domain-containing protein [Maribacter sp.]
MKKKFQFPTRFSIGLFLLVVGFNARASIYSDSTVKGEAPNTALLLESNGFNAKKRSLFAVGDQTEHLERGLTLIHFLSATKYEFKTFDTHADPKQSKAMVEVLWKMQKNNARYALLAHDSAAKSLVSELGELQKMGFDQLSEIKSRQAYIAHNLQGALLESIDDLRLSMNIDIPDTISDNHIYFPRIKYEFTPNNDRYIAHAGGEIDGVKSTNSKQALDANYNKGFRLFELDIITTSDGHLVAAHDWKMWARFTDYQGTLPPSLSEFKKHKIYGDYTTLDMKGINDWFANHPDAILVTDKLNDPVAFANAFVDKDRLLMELFSLMAIEEASKNGIGVMISQEPLMGLKGDKIDYLQINNVKHVALSRRIIKNHVEFMLELKKQGIRVYVYNVNFDPGKDEKYVQENEIGLVYGMYADKWVFDTKKSTLAK